MYIYTYIIYTIVLSHCLNVTSATRVTLRYISATKNGNKLIFSVCNIECTRNMPLESEIPILFIIGRIGG